ncbi:MAG: SEC-C domain-containing protein [Thermodesulfobacteriota bacterium]
MRKKRKRKIKKVAPDDYFAAGPLEFARFGEIIVGRSTSDDERFKESQAKLAAHYPTVIANIDALVSEITGLVAQLPPDMLLHRASWEYFAINCNIKQNFIEHDQVIAHKMIEYVQSIIASVKPKIPYKYKVEDKDWKILNTKVEKLFTILSGEFQICRTAHNQIHDPHFDINIEELRTQTVLHWINVRGRRYMPHDKQALLDILSPHSDVMLRLFGIDIYTLVEELDKILTKLTYGPAKSVEEFFKIKEELDTRAQSIMSNRDFESIEQFQEELYKDKNLLDKKYKAAGEVLDLDLFDLEKVTQLPRKLLNELAWAPGEEEDFFRPGDYCGWPFRVWPTMKRPFIRIDESIYCFDVYSLFDNFYRVFQRLIFRLEPDYKEVWNKKQKEISELLPITYFEKLLPDAKTYPGVCYPWKTGKNPSQWPETDALIAYADHLFILEIKGGAFTHTSPVDDLAAHINSLETLVQTPVNQGNRFNDYIESNYEVLLFNKKGEQLGKLRHSDYRHVTICAITLDSFTYLATRTQHLRKVGIDVGSRPVLVISIDDLRVYADIFQSPLTFLHFVEQRMRAAQTACIDLYDEIDHIGLYLKYNNYSMYSKEIIDSKKLKRVTFFGFSEPIDKYYNAITQNGFAELPKQKLPSKLEELITFLDKSTLSFRAELASYLLDLSGTARNELNAGIDQLLKNPLSHGRPHFGSVIGEPPLTFMAWSPAAPRDEFLAVQHTMVIIVLQKEKSRPLLELEYSLNGNLTYVYWRHVNLDGLTKEQLDSLHAEAKNIKNKRIAHAKSHGKIPVNSLCPCGSGKKYKKCCRP